MLNEQDHAMSIVQMTQYANEKYQYYQKIWVEYDDAAFIVAIIIGAWSIVFNIVNNFGPLDYINPVLPESVIQNTYLIGTIIASVLYIL